MLGAAFLTFAAFHAVRGSSVPFCQLSEAPADVPHLRRAKPVQVIAEGEVIRNGNVLRTSFGTVAAAGAGNRDGFLNDFSHLFQDC